MDAKTILKFFSKAPSVDGKTIRKGHKFVKRVVRNGVGPDFDDMGAVTDLQKRMLKGYTTTATAATLFIAGTSVVDAVKTNKKNKDMREEQERQLKKLEETNKTESKIRNQVQEQYSRQKQMSFYEANLGQTVLDMFEDRTGHHRMGSSRYN